MFKTNPDAYSRTFKPHAVPHKEPPRNHLQLVRDTNLPTQSSLMLHTSAHLHNDHGHTCNFLKLRMLVLPLLVNDNKWTASPTFNILKQASKRFKLSALKCYIFIYIYICYIFSLIFIYALIMTDTCKTVYLVYLFLPTDFYNFLTILGYP